MIIMKIFLDTANIDEIRKVLEWGVLDGITSNPSILKKVVDANKDVDLKQYIKDICETCGKNRPVSLEVVATDYDNMVKEGRYLQKTFNDHGNLFVKIPINTSLDGKNNSDGLRAIKTLSDEGISINTTLIMSPEQALLAAKAGAKIVSPFAGRTDDAIRQNAGIEFDKTDYYPAGGIEKDGLMLNDHGIVSGIDLVNKIVEIYKNFNIDTEVLAASIRNTVQVREMFLVGANIVTLPYDIIDKLLVHEKTKEGLEQFVNDAPEKYKNLFD